MRIAFVSTLNLSFFTAFIFYRFFLCKTANPHHIFLLRCTLYWSPNFQTCKPVVLFLYIDNFLLYIQHHPIQAHISHFQYRISALHHTDVTATFHRIDKLLYYFYHHCIVLDFLCTFLNMSFLHHHTLPHNLEDSAMYDLYIYILYYSHTALRFAPHTTHGPLPNRRIPSRGRT